MDSNKIKKGLGRGLSSLIGETKVETKKNKLSISDLVPNKYQPRKIFDEENLNELANSIRERGILQPIIVRKSNDDQSKYEIIAGERRWRAAQIAKLHEVPVIIRNFDDETALGVALVENLQRSDLNLLEEAEGYRLLMNKFEYTQEKLSLHIGKSRSHIANHLRLLSLPQSIKTYLILGELTYGHVRSILTINESEANEIVNQVIEKGLSVRETESLVRKIKKNFLLSKAPDEKEDDPNINYLEKELTLLLGLKVTIKNSQKNKGSLSIHYNNLDQLDPIIDKLKWRPK